LGVSEETASVALSQVPPSWGKPASAKRAPFFGLPPKGEHPPRALPSVDLILRAQKKAAGGQDNPAAVSAAAEATAAAEEEARLLRIEKRRLKEKRRQSKGKPPKWPELLVSDNSSSSSSSSSYPSATRKEDGPETHRRGQTNIDVEADYPTPVQKTKQDRPFGDAAGDSNGGAFLFEGEVTLLPLSATVCEFSLMLD